MNLVPKNHSLSPNYWCTWSLQSYNEPDGTNPHAEDNLCEEQLFGGAGWATQYLEGARADLYLMLDDGWDIAPGLPKPREAWRVGSLIPDAQRFPSATGTPTERLRQLNVMAQNAGWRGIGIWVAAQTAGEIPDAQMDDTQTEAYYRERLRWCNEAGVEYWKVDWGRRDSCAEFRANITAWARQEAPRLTVEHAMCIGPLNDITPEVNTRVDARSRFAAWDDVPAKCAEILGFSDVFRTYDTTEHLAISTTMDRIAYLLTHSHMQPGAKGLLSCEDEVYLACGLGCCFGVMRHPLWANRVGQDYDPHRRRRRMDEVVRAVRWQRIAPAFGVHETPSKVSETVYFDRWHFNNGDTWAPWVLGKEITQGAPAVIARGLDLPRVQPRSIPPYVVASRHPNGAVAIASLPRTLSEKGIVTNPADVVLNIADGADTIGVFGVFNKLTIVLRQALGKRRVMAQDLAGDTARDITDWVACNDATLILSDELIRRIGLEAASPGDMSQAGMVIKLISG